MSTDAPGDGSSPPSKGATDKALDSLLTLAMSLPVWSRTVVLLICLIAVSGVLIYHFVPEKKDPAASTPAAATNVIVQTTQAIPTYINGRPDPNHPGADNNNPQNKEADHKAAEDDAALSWHFSHAAEDNPPELPIVADTDKDNFLHYRYFAKTDRCVWINRREGGTDHTQWVRDPMYHSHDIDLVQHAGSKASSYFTPASPASILSDFYKHLLPTVQASGPFGTTAQQPEPVQTTTCFNGTHPGTFRYWWGQPIDQCNSPMYRQFGDGCIHYQLYNRCANSWDGRIFWTYCRPPPHY